MLRGNNSSFAVRWHIGLPPSYVIHPPNSGLLAFGLIKTYVKFGRVYIKDMSAALVSTGFAKSICVLNNPFHCGTKVIAIGRIGRTKRIGYRGIPSSLFNEERNKALANILVGTLIETNQSVPDFLQHHMP
ncbi:hypothetical protein CDD81_6634 [Ophiocordyceps australis]|uniref:Uncharacterized protein n=1 Tax=Ophiocordyceps australis TaxID=1399860 RepID=A0A2C5Y7A8_9HYPO|nr:hypothetical protein CDD81_6634 [Ophiocordyceps australis]